MTAIQNWNGKEIDDTEGDGQVGGKEYQTDDAELGRRARHLRDAHRSADLAGVAVAGHHLAECEEQHRRLAEVSLRQRVVYTRTKVQTDVQRLLDLYRISGRFAATVDLAEPVAPAFLDGEGNDECLLIRRQLGDGGGNAKIGITLRQIEPAQQLAIEGQAVGIVAVLGR